METLKLRIETTEKALKTLKAITEEPYSVMFGTLLSRGLNILLRLSSELLFSSRVGRGTIQV